MSSSDSQSADRTSARPLNILVADDEPMLVRALAKLFAHRGHTVETAADAHAALSLLDAHRFDAVLVDARMPGGGLTVIARLEDDPEFGGKLVLMTGALATDPLIQVSPEVVRIQKPFRLHELLPVVEGNRPN